MRTPTHLGIGRLARKALVTAIFIAATASGLAVPPMASGEPAAVDEGSFYIPPNPLPTHSNGELIRHQPSTPMSGLLPGVSANRIMYQSSDTDGRPIAITGTILSPTAAWPGPGPRPLVSYGFGTIGAGDNCAPSKLIADGITVDGSGMPAVAPYFLDPGSLLARGITVVITDYEGLGTPGAHTYLQPVPEAHAVLDAARAAIRFGAATENAPVGIWGYSQGGSAAAGAAEYASSYAPDLNVKGAVIGAPPANVASTLSTVDGKTLNLVIGFFLNGLLASHPEFAPAVNAILNPAGIDFLHRTATQCAFSFPLYAFQHTSAFTVSGRPITDELRANPAIRAVLDSFILDRRAPTAPVLVVQNVNDDVCPATDTVAMENSWRAAGTDVTDASIDTSPLLPQLGLAGHTAGLLLGGPPAVQWLIDRFDH